MESPIIFLGVSLSNWTIITNIAVILVTGILAFATWKMANVAQRTLEEQNKPYVVVYVQPREDEPSVVQIIIENIGTAPAYDIKFDIKKKLYLQAWGTGEPNGKPKKVESGPFIEGITQLVARQKITFNWGQYAGIVNTLNGTSIKIDVFFKNASMIQQPKTESILDVTDFAGSSAHEPTSVRQIKEIEKISTAILVLQKLFEEKLQPQSQSPISSD